MDEFFLIKAHTNVDYFLFGVGFLFIGLAVLLQVYFKQRKMQLNEKQFLFFIVYVFLIGLTSWNDLFLFVFSDYSILEINHYMLNVLAFLSLLEFGRRTFHLKKSNLLYSIPILLLFTNILFINKIILFESFTILVVGLGLFFWNKRNELFSRTIKFLRLLPIILLSYSITIILIELAMLNRGKTVPLLWTHCIIKWIFTVIISVIFLHSLTKVNINDTLEVQLKKLKFKLTKLVIVLMILIYSLGYFLVFQLGNERWENEEEQLLYIANLSSLSIHADLLNRLEKENESIQNMISSHMKKDIAEINKKFDYIDRLFIIDIQINQITFDTQKSNEKFDIQDFAGIVDQFVGTTENNNQKDFIIKENGNYLTAFTPIKNESGKIVGILGINHRAQIYYQKVAFERFLGILFILTLFIIIIGLAKIYFNNQREATWRTNHEKILSSIGDVVGVFDREGNMIYANQAAYRLSGHISTNGRKVQNIRNFLSVNDVNRIYELMGELKRDSIVYSEFTLVSEDGRTVPIFGSMSYLDNQNYNPLYVFTAINITQQKKREGEVREQFQNTLALLATLIDTKDPYTSRHSTNVSRYSKKIAEELGLPKEQVVEIETAALIHDIGKIGISDRVLKKEIRLDEEEWIEMRRHPEYGKTILEKAGKTFTRLIPYVYYHHERYDGSGYPTGMSKPSIPISIISVADAFDAMTSDRSYRKGMSITEALIELKEYAGKQFHPDVVDALIRIVEKNKGLL